METKRVSRSVEEKIAEIDKKIATHKANIQTLEKKKAELQTPKLTRKQVVARATAAGMSPEEMLKRLKLN